MLVIALLFSNSTVLLTESYYCLMKLYVRVLCTFHVHVYLGNGGLSLKTPFMRLVTSECCSTV